MIDEKLWCVQLIIPWPEADDPFMTIIINAETRGKAIANYVSRAQEAGYQLRFIDARARRISKVN